MRLIGHEAHSSAALVRLGVLVRSWLIREAQLASEVRYHCEVSLVELKIAKPKSNLIS